MNIIGQIDTCKRAAQIKTKLFIVRCESNARWHVSLRRQRRSATVRVVAIHRCAGTFVAGVLKQSKQVGGVRVNKFGRTQIRRSSRGDRLTTTKQSNVRRGRSQRRVGRTAHVKTAAGVPRRNFRARGAVTRTSLTAPTTTTFAYRGSLDCVHRNPPSPPSSVRLPERW